VGQTALQWLVAKAEIGKWRNRWFSVKVGNHICWAIAILDPASIFARQRVSKTGSVMPSEFDKVFEMDLKGIFTAGSRLNSPVYIEKDYLSGVQTSEGLKSDKELKRVLDWLEEFAEYDYVGYDYETSCIRPFEKDALVLSVALGTQKKSVSFPLQYPNAWSPDQWKTLKAAFIKFLKSPAKKICHNLKFELEWTAETFGKELIYTNTWEDTQAQAYTLDERRGMLNLDVLIRLHFGFMLKDLSNIDRSRMLSYPLEKILPYNGLDAKWTFALFFEQSKKLNSDKKLKQVYLKLLETEVALTSIQCRGVVLNDTIRLELKKQFEDEVAGIASQIMELPEVKQFKGHFNMTFNPASPDHVLKCLHSILGLNEELMVENKLNTSEAVLSSLKGYALPPLILDFRGITKKISTYLEPMKDYIHPKYNKIHTNFNPFDTSTGRLSSSDPNLQNLPNKTGKEIRKMFTAPEGYWIVSSDYGQIEARIIGVASQDEAFCDALWNNYDVHMKWAEIIANEYPKVIGGTQFLYDKKAMKTFRAKVKNLWVFPAFYGASPFSIAKGLDIPIEIVQDIFNDFWKTFKGVKRWQKWLLNRYDQLGYVETLTGRRRRAPLSMNAVLNSCIQGTASDICVDAMCRLDRKGYDVIMNIHDDVTSYIRDDQLEDAIADIAEEMCAVPFKWINVPISIEIAAGLNWYEQEEIGTFKSTDYHDVPKKIVDFTKLYDF